MVKDNTFQRRVAPWMQQCFGPTISADRVERGDRLAEEVFELLQANGYDQARLSALIDYVWSRPVGDPAQEVGGVMVTLAAYCLAHDLDMHIAGETELARISQPAIVEKIRARHAKKAREIPFSPLPQAATPSPAPAVAEARSISPEIARQVLSMGRVEWGSTAELTHDGHLAHLADSLRITREAFNFADVPVAMHGLYLEGTETILCHTGTSPNSGPNAQALAGAWNWLVDQCQAAIRANGGEG